MKDNKSIFTLILAFFLLTFYGFSQKKEVVSNTDEFDYLIGMEYFDASELNRLDYKSRVGLEKDGIETTSTSFVRGTNQIITSESVRIDPKLNRKVYKILDVIVLNGYYTSCEGCLLSNKKNVTIKSFHPLGRTVSDSIVVAFEKNYITGNFKSVDPGNYKRNSRSKLLKKN